MTGEQITAYRQGDLDSLCGLYALINAMRWATRGDSIEEEFWAEVFSSLVLCTDAHVGMAHVVIGGIGPKPLLAIAREVFGELTYRFGRKFEARRPFRGLSVKRFDCLIDQLAWLTEQRDTAVLMVADVHLAHWTALREVNRQQILFIDSTGETGFDRGADESDPIAAPDITVARAKSVIVIERVRD